jgi:hypothetical protein
MGNDSEVSEWGNRKVVSLETAWSTGAIGNRGAEKQARRQREEGAADGREWKRWQSRQGGREKGCSVQHNAERACVLRE